MLYAVVCKVEAGKVSVLHELILRQIANKCFFLSMILYGYRNFFAPIFLQLSGDVLFSVSMLIDLRFSIDKRFVVYGSKLVEGIALFCL